MDRRYLLAASAGALVASPALRAAAASGAARRPVVLIHGAWHGAWCWSRVRGLLAENGRPVSAVTLTGCGERRHLLARSVTLDTHVQDVLQHIETEELENVALVAHSYGGFVAAAVADRLGARIARLVMLDAFVPRSGERVADYAGAGRAAELAAAAARDPTFNLAPPPAAALGIGTPDDVAWVARRMTPHPVGTYLQPIVLRSDLSAVPDKTYIAFGAPGLPVFDATKARIRADGDWRYVALDAGHDAMVTAPGALGRALLGSIA